MAIARPSTAATRSSRSGCSILSKNTTRTVSSIVALELFKLPGSEGTGVSAGACIVAMLLAAVIGYFALRLVNALAVNRKFKPFWIYCFAVGAIAIIVFLIKL